MAQMVEQSLPTREVRTFTVLKGQKLRKCPFVKIIIKRVKFDFQNTVTLSSEDLMEAEDWIIQLQKAIYSIHCQVFSHKVTLLKVTS